MVNGFCQSTIVVDGFSMVFLHVNHWCRWFFNVFFHVNHGVNGFSMVFQISTIGINGFSNVFFQSNQSNL